MSGNYPYSQESIVEVENGYRKRINYIRNSVKVLVDNNYGTIEFYITDRTDPIIMAYKKIYPSLFKEQLEELPQDVAKHIVYSNYLYNIQSEILEKYHNVTSDILYRGDDIWTKTKENTKMLTSGVGTEMLPYYTMIKAPYSEETKQSLVIPYTLIDRQNIVSYLSGTYENSKSILRLYKFSGGNSVLGTMQLEELVEQDEGISKELESLIVTGAKIEKRIIVVPIDNTLLYVEPIYQTLINESQIPILKKVIVASGNKVAIGNNLSEAITNLLSQNAVSIEVSSETKEQLIIQIINANKNLEQSNLSSNWEMMGKDISRLQELIKQLEQILEKENVETNILDSII